MKRSPYLVKFCLGEQYPARKGRGFLTKVAHGTKAFLKDTAPHIAACDPAALRAGRAAPVRCFAQPSSKADRRLSGDWRHSRRTRERKLSRRKTTGGRGRECLQVVALQQSRAKPCPTQRESAVRSLRQIVRTSLGALGILGVTTLAASADVVGNQGIRFAEDTIVEFEFIESHGAYQSTFGVIDLDSCQTNSTGIINFDSCSKSPLLSEVKASDKFDTVYRRSSYETDLQEARNNDFLGSPGDTVPDVEKDFTFKRGKRYAFYLESEFDGKPAGTVYTTDLINSRGNRQALFNEEGLTAAAVAKRRNNPALNTNKFEYLVDGGLLINFDDTGSTLVKTDNEDVDFDDFIVGMGGGIICNYDQTGKPIPKEPK